MITLESNVRSGWLLAAAFLLLSTDIGCTGERQGESDASPPPGKARVDPRMYDSPDWIDTFAPESSAVGYTLVLYKRRVPMLIDMDGRVVHAWHSVRAVGRARLLTSGHLAVIGESGRLEEYDWQGRLVWSYELDDPETFLHHDFAPLANGNFMALVHDPSTQADFLLEIERSGEIAWRWNAEDHLQGDFARTSNPNNRTHVNSVQELPANRWFENGHEEFRPGNILISARNLNALYIVARPEGHVVWRHYEGMDYQHEATMIPPGIQGAGNIQLFNNGYHDLDGYRQSAVLEINPVQGMRVWEYRRRGFYSSTGGTQQVLANGNLLVTSSQGGRVFELTRDGRIVWQWSPPFKPMRASRYPDDFCPQFEKLDGPSRLPIERRDPDRFIDEDLYAFSLAHQTQRVRFGGKSRYVLKSSDRCQILQIPAGAELVLGYGTWIKDQETPFVADEGPARFVATLRIVDEDEIQPILDKIVDKSSFKAPGAESQVALRHERIPIDSFFDRTVELCLSLNSEHGDATTGSFVWEEPLIRSPVRRAALQSELDTDTETLEKQEKHLKAIGYID